VTYKAARINAGLNLVDASKEIGINKSTLCAYENGKSDPNTSVLLKMCETYGCKIDDLKFNKKEDEI
jgi:DNA-binding XRE family transcriptional regulator